VNKVLNHASLTAAGLIRLMSIGRNAGMGLDGGGAILRLMIIIGPSTSIRINRRTHWYKDSP
jgi:hypothetical protein